MNNDHPIASDGDRGSVLDELATGHKYPQLSTQGPQKDKIPQQTKVSTSGPIVHCERDNPFMVLAHGLLIASSRAKVL
jgi:hypothetical protein